MSQNPTRPCIRCGTPLALNQTFCTNCGARQEGSTPDAVVPPPPPPSQQGSGAGYQGMPQQSSGAGYQGMPSQGSQASYGGYQQGGQGYQQGGQPPYQQVPSYAQANNSNNNSGIGVIGAILALLFLRRAGSRFIGCFIWVIIVIIALTICGLIGRGAINNAVNSDTSSSSNSYNNTGAATPTSTIQKSTMAINQTVLYSGITTTIVDAVQAPSFSDDNNSGNTAGILRLDLKEQTGTINNVSFDYTTNYALVGPDGTTINAVAAQTDSSPAAAVTRTNWIDFPLSKNITVDQYTLRIGDAKEAQINVPLTGKANLSQYQPQKATLTNTFNYGGVTVNVTDATEELSANGPQAPKGMTYVVVDLVESNSSTHTFYGSLTDVRLKSGSTSTPSADGLKNDVEAGQTNVQEQLVFTMPQGSKSFTLTFLASSDNDASAPESTNFQIG